VYDGTFVLIPTLYGVVTRMSSRRDDNRDLDGGEPGYPPARALRLNHEEVGGDERLETGQVPFAGV
jgi:hypothetical protein